MWLLIAILGLTTLIVGWSLFGYFCYLGVAGLFRSRRTPAIPEDLPRFTILVPCHNEEEGIAAKVENLRGLDYPADRLQILIADGCSTDRTVAILDELTSGDPRFSVIRCKRGGKINQMNEVLPQASGDLIVNTDVDAMLEPDALKWIAAEFAASPSVGVVGAYVHPADTIALDAYHWSSQNRARFIESDGYSSSIVVAPCYAFRRGLMSAFPEDVVADDVYVATLANTVGYRTVYSRQARGTEMRGPRSVHEFLRHKLRKSNAVLREFVRFQYRLAEMPGMAKMIVVTRMLQQLLLPWVIVLWAFTAGSLLTLDRYDVVAFAVSFLLLLVLATSILFDQVALPQEEPVRHGLWTKFSGYFLTTFILMVTAITFPFFRQGSNYERLPSGGGQ